MSVANCIHPLKIQIDMVVGRETPLAARYPVSRAPFAAHANVRTGANSYLVQPCIMTSDSPDVGTLVSTLRRHFEHDATRDEVRVAVKEACATMNASGVAPQTMLVALKMAVQSAALEARTVVGRDALRSVTSDLTPWMIDVCFNPSDNWQR